MNSRIFTYRQNCTDLIIIQKHDWSIQVHWIQQSYLQNMDFAFDHSSCKKIVD